MNYVVYLGNNWEMIGGSASFQDVFDNQLPPQRQIFGVLSLPVVQLASLCQKDGYRKYSPNLCHFCT